MPCAFSEAAQLAVRKLARDTFHKDLPVRLVGRDANHWRDFRYPWPAAAAGACKRLSAAIPSSMPGMLAALTYLRGSARWRRSTPCAETSITAPGARTYL